MPTHDIIDNRSEKLVDHINRILTSTGSIRCRLLLSVRPGECR
jgi:hypothetical protein